MVATYISRWVVVSICLLFCSPFGLAQDMVLVQIENGDFESNDPADPDDPTEDGKWYRKPLSATCGFFTDLNEPFFAGAGTVTSQGFHELCELYSQDYDIGTLLTPAEIGTASFVLPYATRNTRSEPQTETLVIWLNDAGAEITPPSTTGLGPNDQSYQVDSATHPYVRGTIPVDARGFRISLNCVAPPSTRTGCAWDNIGPMEIVYDSSTAGPSDPSDPDGPTGPTQIETPFDVDLDDVANALDIAQNLSSAVCDNLPDVSGLGFAPSAFGGSGIGGQIAQIFQGLEANCLAMVSADNDTAQTGALIGPDAFADIQGPDIYVNPLNPSILEGYQNNTINFDDGQDLISASNRTNHLIRTQTEYLLAQNERIYGSGPSRNYETDRGPRITEADLAEETNFEFVEGDYSQTLGRTNALIDAEEIEPDFGKRVDLQEAMPEVVGSGSFFTANISPPTSDGLEGAIETIRWNAAVTLGSSDVGAFIGSIAEERGSRVNELCLGPNQTLNVGGAIGGTVAVTEARPVCIYGPRAPSYLNFMFGLMPAIMLMFSAVAVFKMFVG